MPSRTVVIGGMAVAVAAAGTFAVALRSRSPDVVVGRPPAAVTVPAPGPTLVVPHTDPQPARPGGGGAGGTGPAISLRQPDANPYGEAIPFVSDVAVPDHLVFVLVAGSDARPGERLDRSRADSIHVVALNPLSGTGTVLGIPRDAYVEIPGHGRDKINQALALGGPDLLSATVRRLTGLPIEYWVLTGFEGLTAMVDELGGLRVTVDRRMADKASGAFFEPGTHEMSGREVLAFSRNRKDTEHGDFTRSANHGRVILAALGKMRVEVGDTDGVRRWIGVLLRHVRLDISGDDVLVLGVAGRRTDPRQVANVVAPGRNGKAGRAAVVYLDPSAAALFEDLRDDATVGVAPSPSTSTTAPATTTTTSTTTAPAPPPTAPPSTSTTTTSTTTTLPPPTVP